MLKQTIIQLLVKAILKLNHPTMFAVQRYIIVIKCSDLNDLIGN